MTVSTIEPELDAVALPVDVDEEEEEESTEHNGYVGIGRLRFRFSLSSFRLGRSIFERRFSIAEAALLLMAAYLASRGLGVIRQSLFNAFFGTGAAANAYYAAFRLPDALFNLIAGGALSHAFIPIFVSYEKDQGRAQAWRLTSLIFNVLLVVLTAVLLIGEFLAPTFVTRILVPGYSPAEQELTINLTRIMLVQPLILGLGTIATAVLSSKRQFLLPAVSIAVYNLGLIGGLLLTLAIPSLGIYGPTYGILLAALCQVVVQVPMLLKQGLRYSFAWDVKDEGLRQVMRLLGPNMIVVGLGSAALIVDTSFTSFLPDKASLAAQHNAYMLFYMPVALFAQAISQAALPQLSSLAAKARFTSLRRLALKVIVAALLLGVPTAIILGLLGKPIIRILFQHGAFNSHSSSLTAMALIGYAVGLPGVIIGELIARTFYALKDARTPLFTNILNFGAHVLLILYFLSVFTGKDAIYAIPLAASGSATIEAALLILLIYLRLRKKITGEKEAGA